MTGTPSKKSLIMRSLMIASILLVVKIAAGLYTNSLAILSTAADSFMDFVVSLANFFFVAHASKPADREHPYGHGKFESLAGLLQSLFMAGVALAIAGASVHRFMNPEILEHSFVGIGVMVFAIGLNLWHVRNLRVSMQETNSQLMASEYIHYASDLLTHLGVIAAVVLFQFTGLTYWDPLMSFLIVFYLLFSITQIFRTSVTELLDVQLPDEILNDLDKLIRGFDSRIIDYHDLRTRKVGDTKFFEFHLELRGIQSFKEAHDLSENLVSTIKKEYPGAVVTVHQDPEGAR